MLIKIILSSIAQKSLYVYKYIYIYILCKSRLYSISSTFLTFLTNFRNTGPVEFFQAGSPVAETKDLDDEQAALRSSDLHLEDPIFSDESGGEIFTPPENYTPEI